MHPRDFIRLIGGTAMTRRAGRAQTKAGAPMGRRRFLRAIVGSTVLLRGVATAAAKSRVIGIIHPTTAVMDRRRVDAFLKTMEELGWIEGHNLEIHYRYAEGGTEHLSDLALDFVKAKVDVIITSGTPPTLAARNATSSIPIVFTSVGDPVGAGLVSSLAHPGGNITGLSLQAADAASKRVGLLREILPGLHRLAILANSTNASTQAEMREAQSAALALSIEPIPAEIHSAEEIETTMKALDGRAEAIYVCNDILVSMSRARIGELALSRRLPTVCVAREYVEAGHLISYGADFVDLYRRTAALVDRVLRGQNPGDLPVEQPTKFELVINQKIAKQLGLIIPSIIVARADEIIE